MDIKAQANSLHERFREKAHNRRVIERTTRGIGPQNPDFPLAGLNSYSVFLADAGFSGRSAAAVNLFLPTMRKKDVFAGVRTAIAAGAQLSIQLDRPLRLVSYREAGKEDRRVVTKLLQDEFGIAPSRLTLLDFGDLEAASFGERDVWIATWWATAHTLDNLRRTGRINPAQVVYLIQDYEPMFFPASTHSVLAQNTYHAGFRPLVNSSLLADHLHRVEGIAVPADQVFRPAIDLERIQRTAAARQDRTPGSRIALYYRPKGRNLPEIGLAALKCVARDLGKLRPDLRLDTVGSDHAPIDVGGGQVIHGLGRLDWDDYFRLLEGVDVLISLQATPHPSHPPLDMVASGGLAITNDVDGARKALHPRMTAVRPDPEVLAAAVTDAIMQPTPPGPFDPGFLDRIGRDFTDAIATTAAALR